jgi:hypothetical protein
MEAELDGMVERHEARARAWEERLTKQEAALEERTAAVQVHLFLSFFVLEVAKESIQLPSGGARGSGGCQKRDECKVGWHG